MQLAWKYFILAIVCFIAGILVSIGFRSCKPSEPIEPVIIHDTLTVTDTLRIIEHTKPLYVVRHDTMWVTVPSNEFDSIIDSIAVDIPITQYQYRDTFATDSSSIELGIAFSGYDAKIDSIDLQYRFEVAPRVIEKKNGWGQFIGIGVGVGYGASIVGNTVYAAPEVGLHITYGFGYHW